MAVCVVEDANIGTLCITGALQDGSVLTWLDANVESSPVHTSTGLSSVASFAAVPLSGADAPGFVGLLSGTDGQLVALLAGRGTVLVHAVTQQVLCLMLHAHQHGCRLITIAEVGGVRVTSRHCTAAPH